MGHSMDALEAGLLASLIVAIAVRVNAAATNLVVAIPWPLEWAPIEQTCIQVGLDVGCVLALVG